jgi:hypothetical protein
VLLGSAGPQYGKSEQGNQQGCNGFSHFRAS